MSEEAMTTPLPSRLRASAQEMRSLESIVRVAQRIARELEEAAQALEAKPVAWRVRGYAQFKTGKPGPWRYFDGPDGPAVNTPDCCDFEPLYASPSAQVAQEGGGVSASAYLAKIEADPRRAAALQRARDRARGVATDGGSDADH